jgi:hypothetical protein
LANEPAPDAPTLYLIDTSVWIHALVRRDPPTPIQLRLAELLRAGVAATVSLVRVELLRGARDAPRYRRIERILAPLASLPLTDEVYNDAAQLGFRLRRSGVTVPLVDLVVAATAIKNDSVVVHLDADYELIARHSTLRTEGHL